jgi:hypothetical protein
MKTPSPYKENNKFHHPLANDVLRPLLHAARIPTEITLPFQNPASSSSMISPSAISVSSTSPSSPTHSKITLSKQQQPQQSSPAVSCDWTLTVCLGILLLLQFGMYFAISDDAVFGLQWQTVNVGIIFYVITAHLYQQCLAEMRNHQQHSTKIVTAASASTILSVFPDGVTLIAMLLVCLREIAMAYLFLIACLVLLASIVMGSSIYLLLYVTDADDENNNNDDLEVKQQQQYKFPETPVIRHSMVTFQL